MSDYSKYFPEPGSATGADYTTYFPPISGPVQKRPDAVDLGPKGMESALAEEAKRMGPLGTALAGAGTRFNDYAMRLKQLFGNELTPKEQADVRAGRQLRQVSPTAMLGGIGGDIAMTYPIAPASVLGNVAAGGAIGGATEPVLQGETTAGNIARGAAGQGAGALAVKGISRLVHPIMQTPQVQKLLSEGVVPTPGQAAGSGNTLAGRAVRNVEEAATSIPLVGDLIKGARTRAVGEVQDAAIARATPKGVPPTALRGHQAVEETHNAVSNAYRVALDAIGTVTLDQRFLNSSPKIVQSAVALNPQQKADIANLVEQTISSRINPADGVITADAAKIIDSDLGSYIREFARSSAASERRQADVVRIIQDEWRQLIRRNAPDEATIKLLDDANRSAANLLRVEKAAAKSTSRGGEFTPVELNQAVRELTPDKRRFARGKAYMQDLSDPAAQVLTGRLGESGTVPRGVIGLGVLGGGGVAANEQAGGPEWITRALIAAGLLGPMYTRAGSRYMLGDLIPGQQAAGRVVRSVAPYGGIAGRSYAETQR